MLSETNCDWERVQGVVRCKRTGCGNRVKVAADYPLERIRAACRALDPDLRLRNERLADKIRSKEITSKYAGRDPYQQPCKYQGKPTGEELKCGGCGGGIRSLFACDVFGHCIPLERSIGRSLEIYERFKVHCCLTCDEYEMEDS